MNAVLLFASLALGQTDPITPPLRTPAQAWEFALQQRVPLVVGVGCAPPPGPWDDVLVESLDGFQSPCVVVLKPAKGFMAWHATLPATVSAATIRESLPREKVRQEPGLPRKYDPATQPQFQPKMDRRQRVYYETPLIAPRYHTPAFRAGSC